MGMREVLWHKDLMHLRGYYAVLDVRPAAIGDLDGLARRAAPLLAAGPCCLQLRAKGAAARPLASAATHLLRLCRAAGVPFCVNDRPDVALAVGADAVHLGQEDLPLAEARRFGGRRLRCGVSTHDLAQAEAAAAGGADYVGFGPIFPTRSKESAGPPVGLSGLREVCGRLAVSVVAIGGISLHRVRAVAETGAAAAAVISAVDQAADPQRAARLVAEAFRGLRMGAARDKLAP